MDWFSQVILSECFVGDIISFLFRSSWEISESSLSISMVVIDTIVLVSSIAIGILGTSLPRGKETQSITTPFVCAGAVSIESVFPVLYYQGHLSNSWTTYFTLATFYETFGPLSVIPGAGWRSFFMEEVVGDGVPRSRSSGLCSRRHCNGICCHRIHWIRHEGLRRS